MLYGRTVLIISFTYGSVRSVNPVLPVHPSPLHHCLWVVLLFGKPNLVVTVSGLKGEGSGGRPAAGRSAPRRFRSGPPRGPRALRWSLSLARGPGPGSVIDVRGFLGRPPHRRSQRARAGTASSPRGAPPPRRP